jgi:beta-glucanase (GH16 family)
MRVLAHASILTALLFAAVVACGGDSPAAPTQAGQAGSPAAPIPGYRLVWQDEFSGGALDASKWTAQSGARRTAINTPAAVTVSGGILTITTYTDGGAHHTGFIDTAGKYEPTHGYFEARIRFDSTPGEWGAFWLQSTGMGTSIGNPAAAGTEIDIVEHRAQDQAGADIGNQYVMNLHWDGYGASHATSGSTGRPPSGAAPLAGNWHVYALLWTPNEYAFYLDGIEQWRSSDAVSRRGEFIRLTCEVLDKGWAGNIPAGGYGTAAASATRMQVDWVRVWQAP